MGSTAILPVLAVYVCNQHDTSRSTESMPPAAMAEYRTDEAVCLAGQNRVESRIWREQNACPDKRCMSDRRIEPAVTPFLFSARHLPRPLLVTDSPLTDCHPKHPRCGARQSERA